MRLFPAALSDAVRTDGAAAMNAAPPANFNRVRRVVFMAKLLPTPGVPGISQSQVHGAPATGLMQVDIILASAKHSPSRWHIGQKTSRIDRQSELLGKVAS